MYLTPQHILLAGATGLTGEHLLDRLLSEPTISRVLAPSRSPLAEHAHLDNPVGQLRDLLPQLDGRIDAAFCCLGTTIRQAGSQEAFRAVDQELVLAFARRARELGTRHLLVISALGADPRSSVFYNRVKGEMEQAVSALGYDSVVIARPSMLAGDRESLDQPVRTGERVGLAVMALFRAVTPANLRAIAAGDVAASLCQAVKEHPSGTTILLSGELQRH